MANGLVIRKIWLEKIFHHGKCWEMRSRPTRIRGSIFLIEAGSGLVVGEAVLDSCHYVSEAMASESVACHQVSDLALLKRWCYAWVLRDVRRYETPIPYAHPQGAVIWVSLPVKV